jgi:acetyl esterase
MMEKSDGIAEENTYEQMLKSLRAARKEYALKETIGQRFVIPRLGKEGIKTILYCPVTKEETDKLPVLINMHGGAWIGGDAVLMESFCQMIANEVPAVVANINYKKADEAPFPYAMEEVVDAVKYFVEQADGYGIDPNRIAVGGHSAGAQLAAGAAIKLKEDGIKLACQMLVYPCTDMVIDKDQPEDISNLLRHFFPNGGNDHRYISPLRAKDEELSGLCPAIFIECGLDDLKPMGIAYAKRLIDVAVPVKIKEYPKALHGFLEVNRPDYPSGDERQNPEQESYCKDCEKYLVQELRSCFIEI